ncbi:MAG: citrate lyase acyl carrier protein [Oscillospiraceae bacterium]|nr:citrate lyase acyl carrier protein [Oscillospiraceae bacterium]
MKLKHTAMAGTLESSDIMVTIEPKDTGGIALDLTSSVMQQFGRQIEAVIRDTLSGLGVENAAVIAVDKGALDCTVRARVSAAALRAAGQEEFNWEVRR